MTPASTSCASARWWQSPSSPSVDSPPMRRALAVLLGASVLVLAGCGYKGTVAPTAKDVSGTLPKQTTTLPKGTASSGKQLFASNGCTGCHTYTPAGPN